MVTARRLLAHKILLYELINALPVPVMMLLQYQYLHRYDTCTCTCTVPYAGHKIRYLYLYGMRLVCTIIHLLLRGINNSISGSGHVCQMLNCACVSCPFFVLLVAPRSSLPRHYPFLLAQQYIHPAMIFLQDFWGR